MLIKNLDELKQRYDESTNDKEKKHFKNVLDAARQNRKLEFITVLVAIGLPNKKAKQLWSLLGGLIKSIECLIAMVIDYGGFY